MIRYTIAPLVWTSDHPQRARAETILGPIAVCVGWPDGFEATFRGRVYRGETLDRAKVAAERVYRRELRQALAPARRLAVR